MSAPTIDRIAMHEGSVALPAGFEDRTTNLFVPVHPEAQPNLSIARDWLQDGEDLSRYVSRQVALLGKRLPGHKLLARTPASLGAGAVGGEQIDATYRNGPLSVRQRQAAFVVDERRVLIFSAASPKPFDDAFEALWRGWLASFALPPSAGGEPEAA